MEGTMRKCARALCVTSLFNGLCRLAFLMFHVYAAAACRGGVKGVDNGQMGSWGSVRDKA